MATIADVAVVGAGPSGAWSAYQLAKRGARVRLFDGSHPREKACGGGVTNRALDLVRDGLTDRVPFIHVRRARFVDPRRPAAQRFQPSDAPTIDLPPDALVVASRLTFDGALLAAARRAGVEFINRRVRRVERATYGFCLETADGQRHAASLLIGADGANSLVRRSLATPFQRDQLSIATGYFAHGVTSDEIVIELTSNPAGYLWSFPRPDHLAVGICAQADAGARADQLRTAAAAWIAREGLAPAACLEPYSWPIPSLSRRDFERLQLGGDGWFLAGDAAGLVDPITREGIYFALRSAEYVSEAIVSAAHARYAEQVQGEIANDLAEAARLKAAFFRPRFIGLMMSALARSERIQRVMVDLIAGTQPYRTLKWRLLKTLELGVALQMIGVKREAPALEGES